MTGIRTEPGESTGIRPISWSAVFAGVIVTIVVQLLFTLLGAGIGAATVDPLQQSNLARGLGVGAAIWFLITTLISIYIGARTAGHLSGSGLKADRALHGILTWGTTAIVSMIFMASTVGGLLGGATSMLGGAAAISARSNQNTQLALSPTGRSTDEPQGVQEQAQDEQRAREVADTAAKRVSHAALWSFFVLLVSGIAAARAGGASTPAAWQQWGDAGSEQQATTP